MSSRTRVFFFFNDTATTEIYTLSLHDALPISNRRRAPRRAAGWARRAAPPAPRLSARSEEHTSELQSQSNLVCRLLLEKKKITSHERYAAYTHTPTTAYNSYLPFARMSHACDA